VSLALTQTKTALGVGLQASFLATGGVEPYTYSVVAGGAGGTIDAATGLYTAPAQVNGGLFGAPSKLYDTIKAVDGAAAQITSQILVGDALLLFCEIIQKFLGLANGRVYLWDQKIMEPTDAGLFIAVSELSCKPFGIQNRFNGSGGASDSVQAVNMYTLLQIDVISRNTEARDRKEEVILALDSNYSRFQQDANSFLIGKLPPGSNFVNISSPDGAGIPYRFNISVAIQYAFTRTRAVESFNTFETPQVNTNS
jgi:hypothetical protein